VSDELACLGALEDLLAGRVRRGWMGDEVESLAAIEGRNVSGFH
jgi:hypothetical protein